MQQQAQKVSAVALCPGQCGTIELTKGTVQFWNRFLTIFSLANLSVENANTKCMVKVEQVIQKIFTTTMFVLHEERKDILAL